MYNKGLWLKQDLRRVASKKRTIAYLQPAALLGGSLGIMRESVRELSTIRVAAFLCGDTPHTTSIHEQPRCD
jgi:hypothetical protein